MTQPSKKLPPVLPESGRSLYITVREAVRSAIDGGTFAPGEQIPSTKELSKQLGVSLVTVHRALQELVASGVLRRGQGRGTYVHEDYGDRNETSAGLRFGLVFHRESSLADFYHSQVLEGVRQSADELGVDLVLLRFGEDWRNECQGYLYVNPFEAILDRPPRFGAKLKGKTGNGRQPMMVVGASFERAGVSSVDTDNKDMARQAVEHLAKLGHTRVGLVGGAGEVSNDRDRLIGYREAVERLKLVREPAMEITGTGWRMDDEHKARLAALLRSPERPTAIFAAGYYFALDVFEAAKAVGLRIPEDLSIVSIDDPASAEHLSPALTTMRQPLIQVGRLAARGLFEQIGQEHAAAQRTMLMAELVVRASTARLGGTPTESTVHVQSKGAGAGGSASARVGAAAGSRPTK